MTTFLRLLSDTDKHKGLSEISRSIRSGSTDLRVYDTNPYLFQVMPGAPFAYWVSEQVREAFAAHPRFESIDTGYVARRGLNSNDDFRFLRTYWEIDENSKRWVSHPKGGEYNLFYADLSLVADWLLEGDYLEAERVTDRVYAFAIVPSKELYFRPGLTWSRRTKSRLSMRVMPTSCIFGDKGPAAIVPDDDPIEIFALLGICASQAFYSLVEVQLAAADARPGGAAHSFEVGVIQRTPVPLMTREVKIQLASLARRAWHLKRCVDTVNEISHAYLLPAALRSRQGNYNELGAVKEIDHLQSEINTIAFDLYGFSQTIRSDPVQPYRSDGGALDDEDEEEATTNPDQNSALLSWCVGVAFGRFDWRLAIGEREAPPEPDPFDPLPVKSAGMLPDGAVPFHAHSGILIDDPGHPHDLPRLIEDVLATVDHPAPEDMRHWLRRYFFPHHLRQYSKSRRKAPIYWPLSTASGSYTLWLYYPALTDQTLYTAANDFVAPKLDETARLVSALRTATSRSRDEERQFEELQDLEAELQELQGELLRVAPTWKPNHDDGAQITAAPLWHLFRHRPWQTVLKETWENLEKGDYDWAHLAMTYCPDRVREKCRTDKSLAIAHDLEDLYEPPPEKAGAGRSGRKRLARAS
jgi:hypothetical protein